MLTTQRFNAYWRQHGRQGTSSDQHAPLPVAPSPPYTASPLLLLPPALLAEATLPLPETSFLFREAARSADALDETGLDSWDDGPPYALGPPSNSTSEMHHTQCLEQVMHGRFTRMRREGQNRQEQLSREQLEEELESAVRCWDEGRAFIEQYEDGHRELAMARLWRQWLARDAHFLYLKLTSIQ